MREGKIIRIQDSTDQATTLQAAGLSTAIRVPADNLAEVSTPDLRGLVPAGNVTARGPLSVVSLGRQAAYVALEEVGLLHGRPGSLTRSAGNRNKT